jgi:hypothetical protein
VHIKPAAVAHVYNPSTVRLRQKDCESRVSMGYIGGFERRLLENKYKM